MLLYMYICILTVLVIFCICVFQKYCAIAYFIYYLHVLCQKWWIKDVQPILVFNPSVRPVCPSHNPCSLCTSYIFLGRFFPYLVQIIISMRRCVTCNGPWPRPISSRSLNHDFAIKLLKCGKFCHVLFILSHSYVAKNNSPWGEDGSRTISMSIGQRSGSDGSLEFLWSGRGISQLFTDLQFLVHSSVISLSLGSHIMILDGWMD